jgi:hypothetical protein
LTALSSAERKVRQRAPGLAFKSSPNLRKQMLALVARLRELGWIEGRASTKAFVKSPTCFVPARLQAGVEFQDDGKRLGVSISVRKVAK